MESCNPRNLKKWVEFLALEVGPRPYNDPERLKKVAGCIRQYLLENGYEAELQKFSYKKNEYFNVIGCAAGQRPLERSTSSLLVVGAHYDTVGSTPGADDNASAVAGLLEIEQHLINIKATTSEKLGFIGKKEGVTVHAVANLTYYNWKDS